jgi:hypothetical protein
MFKMRKLQQSSRKYVPQIWTALCHVFEQSTIQTFIIYMLFLFTIVKCGNVQDPINRPSPFASDTLQTDLLKMSIAYSSPRVRERKIWNDLVPYDKIWRTGANEATVFDTNENLLLQGNLLPRGKYSVFTIPSEDNWTIIFNKDWDQWGAYAYAPSKDVLRITIHPQRSFSHQEEMTFTIKKDRIEFRWENLGYNIPFELAN